MRTVAAGQKIDFYATEFNDWQRAAQDFKNRLANIKVDQKSTIDNPNQVFVRNDTGGDLPQYSILGINGPIIAKGDNEVEFKRQVALKGIAPATGTHEGRFVVLATPLADGKIGKAWISGVCPCLTTETTSGDKYADITDGVTDSLTTNPSHGVRLLYRTTGSGNQLSIVNLSMFAPESIFLARTQTGAGNGTSILVKLLTPAGAEIEPAVTAYFLIVDSATNANQCLPLVQTSKTVAVAWIYDRYYIISTTLIDSEDC